MRGKVSYSSRGPGGGDVCPAFPSPPPNKIRMGLHGAGPWRGLTPTIRMSSPWAVCPAVVTLIQTVSESVGKCPPTPSFSHSTSQETEPSASLLGPLQGGGQSEWGHAGEAAVRETELMFGGSSH